MVDVEKVLKFYQFPPDPYLPFQIVSVSGVLIRSSSDFTKLVKLKSSDLHTEIIIRRTPFGQVFHLKPEVDGQSLGVVPHANTPELKEVIPGSQAAQVTRDCTNMVSASLAGRYEQQSAQF